MVNLKRKCEPIVKDNLIELHNLTKEDTQLQYIETKVFLLDTEREYVEILEQKEVCIVILSGKVNIQVGEDSFENLGRRKSVFDNIPTDSLYVGNGETFKITSEEQAKIILCYSPTDIFLPTTLISAEDVSVENRGILNNQRMVQNILTDTSTISDKLLVVEVYTAGGNWSSYPPHKHDEDNLPEESLLEEIYYHEINSSQGFVFQRVYTDDLSIDETMTVNNEEIVLVPKGYHPVGVPDGYESYYLNIMAGPKKVWKFHNDPKHEWILKRGNDEK